MFLNFNMDVRKIKKNLLILTGMTYNFSWKDLLLFLAVTKKNLKDFGLCSNCNYDVLHLHHKNFIGIQSYHRERGFGSSHIRAPMLKSCLLLFYRVMVVPLHI